MAPRRAEAVEKPSEARSWPSVDRPKGSEGAEFGRLRPDLQRSEGHFWIAIDFFNSLEGYTNHVW